MTSAAQTIFARDVDQIDIAYLSPEGIAGKSYHVDVSATGPLDHNGFVIDFGVLKKQIKAHLKATADHALVVPAHSPGFHLEQVPNSHGGTMRMLFTSSNGQYGYECPPDAIYTIGGTQLDATELAQRIIADLKPHLPEGLEINLTLTEKVLSENAVAFSYTHGISRHDGLCQRLFHGHTGELQLKGVSDPGVITTLSEDCFGGGLHIASKDQLVSKAAHPLGNSGPWHDRDSYFLSYEGTLGQYSAVVPKHRTLLLPATASIEHLAGYVFDKLHADHKDQLTPDLELRIWEGLNKGAKITGSAHSCHSKPPLSP